MRKAFPIINKIIGKLSFSLINNISDNKIHYQESLIRKRPSRKKFCYENISKGTKFQDYCIDSIGKRLIK